MSWLMTLMLLAGEPPLPAIALAAPASQSVVIADGEPAIDARAFFDLVVARYRALQRYEDTTRVVRVTRRDGEADRRVETRIGCAIDDGELRVETALAALRRRAGLGLPVQVSPAMERARLSYQLWMAPHMALRYGDPPASAVLGVTTAAELTATDADIVTIDERELVHVELSDPDADAENASETTLDIYVNPDSMLVERILGQQVLPDGGNYETTLDITPLTAVSDDEPFVEPELPFVDDDVEDPEMPVVIPPDGDEPIEPAMPPAIEPMTGPPGARPGA